MLDEGCLLGRALGTCQLSPVPNILIIFVEGGHVWGQRMRLSPSLIFGGGFVLRLLHRRQQTFCS